MNILGINYFFHDSSACIVSGGQLIVALEEERFSRQKHAYHFPEKAIGRCLAVSELDYTDVDYIAVSISPFKNFFTKIRYAASLGAKALPFIKHEFMGIYYKQSSFNAWLKKYWPDGKKRPRIHFIEHHHSHVIGSFLVSPYQKAALLSIDGSGEWSTAMLGEADHSKTTIFAESWFPHSLGSFYEAATQFCGFRANYDEGKTMGLAPFGDPAAFYNEVNRLVTITADGRIQLDLDYFAFQNCGLDRCSAKFYSVFGAPRKPDEPFRQHHQDLAAAFQRVLEEKILELCRILEKRSDCDYLVVAGGVALNSVANGRVIKETRFKDIYIMPGAGDNGTCIGAAYCLYNRILRQPDRHHHGSPYLGTEYTDDEIEQLLQSCKLRYSRSKDICRDTAQLLSAGEIVGWFQGRMEIGPRALGSRSILADPTIAGMKDKINAEVKHREPYRPFAPSCPAEHRTDYFDIAVEDPFMLKVCSVKPEQRHRLPAITHVDGSARLQTVDPATNPLYHRMINAFGDLSGIPVVLNTSFNIMGEPIVESPADAIRCFFSTGLDVLAIGSFIVRKN